MERKFLVHERCDDVGVAVKDISPGETVEGIVLEDHTTVMITAKEPIAFGHKIALYDIAAGSEIKRYGASIGIATQPICKGAHVHVHNVRSARC